VRYLIHAARPLANDLLSTLVFVILVALKVDPRIASGCAIGFGVLHVLVLKLRGLPVPPLQWAGLGLILIFGTASLLMHDVRFLMAKPTVIYLILAGFMLKRGWMLRYMPPIAAGHGEATATAFGYVWAGLMMALAAANLVTAIWFPAIWPAFMAVVPTVAKLALFAMQFGTTRWVVRRRIIAARALAASPA